MFTLNQKVKVDMGLANLVDGTVIMDGLLGRWPFLIKVKMPTGDEMCVQSPADGGGKVFPLSDKGTKYISYIFGDGTATPLREAPVATMNGKTALAAVTAYKRADGSFYNYELTSFEDMEDDLDDEELSLTSNDFTGFKTLGELLAEALKPKK